MKNQFQDIYFLQKINDLYQNFFKLKIQHFYNFQNQYLYQDQNQAYIINSKNYQRN